MYTQGPVRGVGKQEKDDHLLVLKPYCNRLMESAGNSNWKRGLRDGQINPGVNGQLDNFGSRRTVNRTSPSPGQRIHDKGQESFLIKTLWCTDTKPGVFKGVLRAYVESAPVVGKGRLE